MERSTTRTQGLKALVVGAVVAVMSTVAVTSWAEPGPGPAPGQHGPRGGPPPMGGPGMLLMAPPERIDRMVDRMLDGLDATDAQRTQIRQIAQAAAKDVRAQMEAGKGLREKGRALFTAPTIDEAAVEALRQQQAQSHEAVSRRVTQAMVDAAKVLNAKQRETLAARMEKHHRPPMRHRDQGSIPSSVPLT
jgi:Spy/CpxP family protein refolding chaperone